MSKEIVENLLEQIKVLARSDKNKFASYKSRYIRSGLSDSEAIISAAEKLGVYPKISQSIHYAKDSVLAAVGNGNDSHGKVLTFPSGLVRQTPSIIAANSLPTDANSLPTVSDAECDKQQTESAASTETPTVANTVPTVANTTPAVKKAREGREQISRNWTRIAKSIGYGAVFFVCTAALVYLSAEAAGGGAWAYFWAILTEAGGIACIIHPARRWNKAGLVTLGLLCILLGYSTMLTGVFKKSDSELTQTVSTDQNVKDLEEQIERSKKGVTDAEKLRDDLPATWVSKKREAQVGVDEKSRELTSLYASLKVAREGASKTTNANIIGLWTGVEGFRRFILLVFSIVVGHAFFRSCTLITSKKTLFITHENRF